MTTKDNYNFSGEIENATEEFIINNLNLVSLPSDVLAFSSNAMTEATFMRSKAVFSVRSRYAKGKVILTIPISLDFKSLDSVVETSREQYFELLSQVNAYPYVFIKSSRVYSYISDKAKKSSTGYMMFAVDEITVNHIVDVQDVLFVELSLVYSDHTSQTPDFRFIDDPANATTTDHLYDSTIYNSYSKEVQTSDNDGIFHTYNDLVSYYENTMKYSDPAQYGALPFSKAILFAPQILHKGSPEAVAVELAHKEGGGLGDAYKEISITSQDGDSSLTAAMLQNSNGDEDAESSGAFSKDYLVVIHKAFHDLELAGDAAITKITCSRKNKISTQFIGGHQNPFVQYMGRYPARLSIEMTFNNKDVYKHQLESTITALNSLSSIISYNNSEFPEASAYNTLKIKSLATSALGIVNIVPSQSSIQSSSTAQGLEQLTVTFVESDMEEFMKIGNVINGRNVTIASPARMTALTKYMSHFAPSDKGIATISEEVFNASKHIAVLKSLYSAYGGMFAEFRGGDNAELALKKQSAALVTLDNFPNTIDTSFGRDVVQILQQRGRALKYRDSEAENKDEVNTEYKDIPLTFEYEGNQVDMNKAYRQSGIVESMLQTAFYQLSDLSQQGDKIAIEALSHLTLSSIGDIVEKQLFNYTGTNIDDLSLHLVGNKSEAYVRDLPPFFFIQNYVYFDEDDIKDSVELASDTINKLVDEVVNKDIKDQAGDSAVMPSKSFWIEAERTFSSAAMNYQSEGALNVGMPTAEERALGIGAVAKGFDNWNTKPVNSDQQRIRSLIATTVRSLITGVDTTRQDQYIRFFTQSAGLESRLGKEKGSQVLYAGVFQLGVDFIIDALGVSRSEAKRLWAESKTNDSLNIQIGIKGDIKIEKQLARLGRSYHTWTNIYIAHQQGPTGSKAIIDAYREKRGVNASYASTMHGNIPNFVGVSKNGTSEDVQKYYDFWTKSISAGMTVEGKDETQFSDTAMTGDGSIVNADKTYKNNTTPVIVTSIEDGDTVYVKTASGQSLQIRFNRIDAPETKHSGVIKEDHTVVVDGKSWTFKGLKWYVGGQAWGRESTQVLSGLIGGKGSKILIDRNAADKRDVYDRATTNVYKLDGTDIQLEMIKAGAAIPVNTRDEAFQSAYRQAKADRKGQFGVPGLIFKPPADFRNSVQKKQREESLIADARLRIKEERADKIDEKPSTLPPVQAGKLPTRNNIRPYKGDQTITSGYGDRKVSGGSSDHKGYDFGLSGGTEVYSVAGGVAYVRYSPKRGKSINFGHWVEIDHENGFKSRYAHLSKVLVKDGQRVSGWQVVGLSGNSGVAEPNGRGYHLHYEVRYGNSIPVHPFYTTPLHLIPKGTTNYKDYIDPAFLNGKYNPKLNPGPNPNGISGTASKIANEASGDFQEHAEYSDDNTGSNSVSHGDTDHNTVSREIPAEYSVYNENTQIISHARNMTYMQKQGLNVAFPVIKAYITVGNENEDIVLGSTLRLDQYFEIKGIEDFKVACNNDTNPVDTCILTIANPSFIRLDNYSIAGHFLKTDFTQIGTSLESQFIGERLTVRPGMKLHIRVGYGNDPNLLTTLFNGIVTSMSKDNGYALDLICEGFGKELLSYYHSPAKVTKAGGPLTNSSSPVVIGYALQADSIAHFGKRASFWKAAVAASSVPVGITASIAKAAFWTFNPLVMIGKQINDVLNPEESNEDTSEVTEAAERYRDAHSKSTLTAHDISDPESKRLTAPLGNDSLLLTNFSMSNYRQRLFMNIYAAEIEYAHSEFSSGFLRYIGNLFSAGHRAGYHYLFNNTTPWEAVKEMEHRHPGTLTKPLMYDDRMTIFFGIKEQLYIARDLDPVFMAIAANVEEETFSSEYLHQRPKRFEPVCNFHVLSTNINILTNGLGINSNYATSVNVLFFDSAGDYQLEDRDSFEMAIDDDLVSWDVRQKTIAYNGAHGDYSAWMYGTQELKREAETMYGGKIIVTGNPKMKAGDYAYLSDDLRKINGIIKIRECTHIMNSRDGYITEIVPGQYVEAKNFVYSMLFLKLGFAAKTALASAELLYKITGNGDEIFLDYKEVLETLSEWTADQSITEAIVDNGALPEVGLGAITGLLLLATKFYGDKRGLNLLTSSVLQMGTTFVGETGKTLYTSARAMATAKYGASILEYKEKILTRMKTLADAKAASKLKTATVGGVLWRIVKLPVTLPIKITTSAIKLPFKLAFNSVTMAAVFKTARGLSNVASMLSYMLLTNPIGWLLKIAGSIVLGYVFKALEKSQLTREPLLFFPLNQAGRPYQGGMRGYKHNTWWESKQNNWNRNIKEVNKAATFISLTSHDELQKNLASFIARRSKDIDNKEESKRMEDAKVKKEVKEEE